MPDAESAARRLVHLAEDHHHVRQHTGILHVAVKLLAFATTLANAAKNAGACVVTNHVVNHFGEQHRLAHTRPAEKPRLAASLKRHKHIDDFNTGFEDFRLRGTSRQWRWSAMYRTPLDIRQRGSAIDGVAKYVEHAREHAFADRCF